MTAAEWLQIATLVVAIVVVTRVLGAYLAKVFGGGAAPGDKVFGPIERVIYRLGGIDPEREQRWSVYALSLLAFSAVSVVLLYALAARPRVLARSTRRRSQECSPALCVQHRGQLRHQHELAELLR